MSVGAHGSDEDLREEGNWVTGVMREPDKAPKWATRATRAPL